MRWVLLAAGVAFVVVAFTAATHVADTREGLIAEIITLLSGLAGVSLVLYGLFAGTIRRPGTEAAPASARPALWPATRSSRDLAIGGAGIGLALFLLGGLAMSGGFQWAGLGTILLLPMIVGSLYLCARFIRAPSRAPSRDSKEP